MKYYVSCGGYTIEELIADALSLSNRKHISNTQITEQSVSGLDGVYTYNNTRYDVEIKAYYDHPSARNRIQKFNQYYLRNKYLTIKVCTKNGSSKRFISSRTDQIFKKSLFSRSDC